MAGDIDRCWLLAYRAPIDKVSATLPKPLEPVTFGGFAYLNVVVSELSHMRPAFLPRALGLGYRHAAYRAYARFGNTEGLYFLRSDADSPWITTFGNLLTDFRLHKSAIDIVESQSRRALVIRSEDQPGVARLDLDKPARLQPNSPFASLKDAEAFLKYKPAALSVHDGNVDILRIQRDEAAWKARLVHVDEQDFEFCKPFDANFEICYQMEPIRYVWKRAVRLQ
jgi:hypothetical protein